MSQIPRRPLDESIFEAISSRAGSSIVDISTVLERVDSIERWLLTFEELDGGLQRLSDDGRIAEVDIGRFVSLASPHARVRTADYPWVDTTRLSPPIGSRSPPTRSGSCDRVSCGRRSGSGDGVIESLAADSGSRRDRSI